MSAIHEKVIEVIMRGLKAYAPDEVETYGHDEAEMIADYVEPFVAAEVQRAVGATWEEAAKAVPTNWVDSLLTGPDGIGDPPYHVPQIERLLLAIRDRLRTRQQPEGEGR